MFSLRKIVIYAIQNLGKSDLMTEQELDVSINDPELDIFESGKENNMKGSVIMAAVSKSTGGGKVQQPPYQ